MSKSLLAPILTRNQRLSVRRGQGAGNGRAAYVFEAGPRKMPSTMMLNGCQLRKRYRTQTRRSEERCGRESAPFKRAQLLWSSPLSSAEGSSTRRLRARCDTWTHGEGSAQALITLSPEPRARLEGAHATRQAQQAQRHTQIVYLVLPVFAPVDKLKVRANGGGLIFDLAAVAVFY